jgi:hypothetical protein
MLEIKLSQGPKPGKGGILPGGKVTVEIAAIRGISEVVDSISPNRHPEINNKDDLFEMFGPASTWPGKYVKSTISVITNAGGRSRQVYSAQDKSIARLAEDNAEAPLSNDAQRTI